MTPLPGVAEDHRRRPAITVHRAIEAKLAQLRERDSRGERPRRRWPVLDGLASAGLSGRDVAGVVGVSPPTVSKWRSGQLRVPGHKLAFLTLVLAHLLEDLRALGALKAGWGSLEPNWRSPPDPAGAAALRALEVQEGLNLALPVADVRKGAQLFRAWWASGSARYLHEIVAAAFDGVPADEDNTETRERVLEEDVA